VARGGGHADTPFTQLVLGKPHFKLPVRSNTRSAAEVLLGEKAETGARRPVDGYIPMFLRGRERERIL
jgi:hypothetical protein